MWPVSDAVGHLGRVVSGLRILYAVVACMAVMNAAEIWLGASVSEPCSLFHAINGESEMCTVSDIRNSYYVKLACFVLASA
eukprot:scaffold650264_cov47-Prasinocladus_malaysianus.AAC.1